MDDRRVGLVIRALRRRRGWRQADLAVAARTSQSTVARVEAGHLEGTSIQTLRRIFAALEARLVIDIRWRGGELDRLMDEDHAQIATISATDVRDMGWLVLSEVTFLRLGERGSIDLLAANEEARAAAMLEIKSEITSAEETQRRFDAKARVLASVVEERLGWRPSHLGAILVVADTSRNRRRMAVLAPLLGASASGTRAVKYWLREPRGTLVGTWFVRLTRARGGKCRARGSHRVRRPPTS